MKKISKKTINISNKIAPILNSRDVIRDLFPFIKKIKSDSVNLDFRNIKFVSRSAAHELLLLKERLARQKNIEFINLSAEVEDMIRLVASSRAVPKRKKINFKVERISIEAFCRL